jgi:hypothetical protein
MKITYRSLHRDLGYFFVGLIIAFSISGLFLNHREVWHPLNYEYASESVNVGKNLKKDILDENRIEKISETLNINDKIRRFGFEDDIVWVSYEKADLEFNLSTGAGSLKKFMVTPVLGQMTQLHIDTNVFWIYYSDIFAISLLVIAITAIIFPKGKYSFKKYGWKLALSGLLFPLIFLLFLS